MGDDLPIKFEINGNGEDSIDLVNTMLYVQAADATVEPVNLFLHNVFSYVNISCDRDASELRCRCQKVAADVVSRLCRRILQRLIATRALCLLCKQSKREHDGSNT